MLRSEILIVNPPTKKKKIEYYISFFFSIFFFIISKLNLATDVFQKKFLFFFCFCNVFKAIFYYFFFFKLYFLPFFLFFLFCKKAFCSLVYYSLSQSSGIDLYPLTHTHTPHTHPSIALPTTSTTTTNIRGLRKRERKDERWVYGLAGVDGYPRSLSQSQVKNKFIYLCVKFI